MSDPSHLGEDIILAIKSYLISPCVFSLIHCRISPPHQFLLAGFILEEHQYPDTYRAAVLNR